ncbi:MAG: MFS transporter [Gammaproteobacteria bacterium]|nr:MFS transporter [Gammaproteobacteria bacterium]
MNHPSTGSFGPVLLAEGVTTRHVLCYLFAALISIGMFTYLMSLTPYILKVNLGIPESEHGRVVGNLQFLQEIIVMASIGWWGALSDRIGRRNTYIIAWLIMMVAYGIYAFATSLPGLFALRIVFALGVAATTTNLSAILADYPQDPSRGKMTGIAFLLNGLGAAIFFGVLNQLPSMYQAQGADELWAGRYAYLTIAAVAFVAAIVMTGLKPGRPEEAGNRDTKPPILQLMKEGLRAAKNKRIGLSYLAAFAARADMAIVTLFLILWIIQAGGAAGMTPAEAQGRAGIYVAVYSLAALVAAPFVGVIADKIDRLALTIGAFAVAAAGYGWLGTSTDVLSIGGMIPALVLAGFGQSSVAMAITVLLAQQCPPDIRGSVFGVQSFFGAVGILAISWGGGQLFDLVSPGAPFIAVACANALVFLAALALRAKERAA